MDEQKRKAKAYDSIKTYLYNRLDNTEDVKERKLLKDMLYDLYEAEWSIAAWTE